MIKQMICNFLAKLMFQRSDKVFEALDKKFENVASSEEEIDEWAKFVSENEKRLASK